MFACVCRVCRFAQIKGLPARVTPLAPAGGVITIVKVLRSGVGTFPGPTGPAAFGRPGSPERDCGPGCQSRHRREPRMPRDTVLRASSTARVFREVTGPGPGGTDSDDSLQRHIAACWTRMEDPYVRAGEVVIRKTLGHGTIRRGRFIKSRPEKICCTAQLKHPRLARDPEIKPQHVSGFPCRPCRLHIVSCFSVI